MKIELDITPALFRSLLSERIRRPGAQMPWLVEDIVIEILQRTLQPLVDAGSLLGTKLHPYRYYKPTTLAEAAAGNGVVLWYLRVEIDAPLGAMLSEMDVAPPKYLVWRPINYGAVQKSIKFKHRTMKTRERYSIEIMNPVIPAYLFQQVLEEGLKCSGGCAETLLDPVIDGVWDWKLRFVCRVCSQTYFCSCFEGALTIEAEQEKAAQVKAPPVSCRRFRRPTSATTSVTSARASLPTFPSATRCTAVQSWSATARGFGSSK